MELQSRLLHYALTAFAGGSLVMFKTAFLKKREYFPMLPLFSAGPTLPFVVVKWSFFLSLFCFAGISIASDPTIFLITQGLLITLWMLFDENFWCPHLIHWNLTCFCLAFHDFTSLKLF